MARRMNRAATTTIAIVDQRPTFRDLVAEALLAEGFAVDSPDDVVDWAAHPGRLIIVDLTGPDGVDVLVRVRRDSPHVPILALVDGQTAQDYSDALHRGATNVVSMRAHPHVVVEAVHAALTGRVVLPPEVVKELTRSTTRDPRPRLSVDDVRILQLMASGQSMAKIARQLHVSERTLYREARRLNRSLGAANRAEALVKAAQWGFLQQD